MAVGASALLLCDSECPVTEVMTYWERQDILGDANFDYADGGCDHPGDFDYDDPRDYEEWCDWNDTEKVEGYYHPDHLHEDGGFVYFKDAFEPELDQVVPSGDVYAAAQVVFQPAELPSLHEFSALPPCDATVGFGDSVIDACDTALDTVIHYRVVHPVEPSAIHLSVLPHLCCDSESDLREISIPLQNWIDKPKYELSDLTSQSVVENDLEGARTWSDPVLIQTNFPDKGGSRYGPAGSGAPTFRPYLGFCQ